MGDRTARTIVIQEKTSQDRNLDVVRYKVYCIKKDVGQHCYQGKLGVTENIYKTVVKILFWQVIDGNGIWACWESQKLRGF